MPIITSETTPTSHLVTGHCKVSRVVTQLTECDQPLTRGVLIVADKNNTTTCYVSGDPSVTHDNSVATGGLPLANGQSVIIPCASGNLLFLIADCDPSSPMDVAFMLI